MVIAGFSGAVAQPNYRQAALDTSANFYQIVADFEAWIDSVQLPDSVKTLEIKKFGRWASYWQTRVQYSDPQLNGSFAPYQQALGAYWVNPSCTGTDDAQWENAGPYPEDLHNMGFIQSVWFDHSNPDFILIGSGRRAGIMKSTDRGQTWQDVLSQERIPALGIPFISASPILEQNGKRTFYAATGSSEVGYSIGIIKSSDDGETWDILPDFPLFADQKYNYVVRKVLAAPVRTNNTNPDILYAIAMNTFYKSVDGGITWTTNIPPFNNDDFEGTLDDMEVDPNNNDVIAISGLPAGGGVPKIWLSTDGGDIFTEILTTSGYTYLNDVLNLQIDFPSSDRLYVLTREANQGGILFYDFSLPTPAWNTSNTNNYMVVAGKTNQFNRAFKVTSDHSYYYIGTDCFSISTANAHGYCIFPYEITANYHPDARCVDAVGDMIMVGTDGGLLYTADMGATWSSINGNGKTGLTNNEVSGFDITGGFENNIVVGLIDNSFKFFDKKWLNGTPLTVDIIWPSYPQNNNPQTDPMGVGDGWKCKFYPSDKSKFLIHSVGLFKVDRTNLGFRGTHYNVQLPITYGATDAPLLPIEITGNPPKVFVGARDGIADPTYSAISISNDLVSWSNSLLSGQAMVSCITTAPTNINIMYANTLGLTYSSTCEKGVYRSIDGGDTWTDITGGSFTTGVRNGHYPVVDIAVDYNNPNKVWVCLGGVSFNNTPPYPPFLENRVFRTDDASANPVIWVDMTGGPNGILPPLPTTAIVNQPGTSRVFLATDGGIFCRSDNDPDWICFSNNFPVTHITDLKINRETNELFASTYGYGVWKAALPCESAQQSYIIDQGTGDVTWSNTTFSAGDIVVKSGYKLTINENAQIFMDPNTSILVESGAELIVNNATLTTCSLMWQGIKVMGNFSMPQNTTNQGKVTLLNGATIGNARVGIETGNKRGAGGIIQAENTYFYNCEYGIKMYPYKNFNPVDPSVLRPNLSSFIQCTFATTGLLTLPGVIPQAGIWLNGIHHLLIEGCTFKNNSSINIANPVHLGYGIQAFASTFLVMPHCTSTSVPCTEYKRSSFSNLFCGIHAGDALTNASFFVNSADFNGNVRGIEVVGMNGFTVTSNEFIIPSFPDNSPIYPVGLQLDGCKSGFRIEDNEFTAEWQAEETMIWENAGLVVDNSGPLNNFVYNNRFSNTSVATIAQGQNKQYFNFEYGLQYCCNQFDHHLNALAITNVAMGEGIAANQGFYINVPGTPTTQLSNNFFQDVHSGPTSEIHNDGTWLNYYYHFDQPYPPTEGTTTNPKPHVSSGSVFLHAVINNWNTNNCPSNLGGTSVSSLKLANTSFKNKANACREVIEQLVDGGDTENMLWTIEDSEPGDAYDLMLALLEESPYLSELVLVSVVQNEEVLTPAMVTQILTANPQASHSQEVWEALYDRTLPLPQYMLDAIEYNINVSSPKEVLENELAYYLAEQQKTFADLSRYFLNNTDEQIEDELLDIYANDSSLQGEILLVTECLKRGMMEESLDRLDSIPIRISLDSIEQAIYNQQKAIIELHLALLADSSYLDSISPESVEWLRGIAANSGNHTAMAAQALLGIVDTLPYHGPVYFPTTQPARLAKKPAHDPKINYLKLFPNPSREYFMIEYALDNPNLPEALIEIRTIDGRLVKTIEVKDPQNQIIINTHPFARGMYLCLLKQGTNTLAVQKIVIEK